MNTKIRFRTLPILGDAKIKYPKIRLKIMNKIINNSKNKNCNFFPLVLEHSVAVWIKKWKRLFLSEGGLHYRRT